MFETTIQAHCVRLGNQKNQLDWRLWEPFKKFLFKQYYSEEYDMYSFSAHVSVVLIKLCKALFYVTTDAHRPLITHVVGLRIEWRQWNQRLRVSLKCSKSRISRLSIKSPIYTCTEYCIHWMSATIHRWQTLDEWLSWQGGQLTKLTRGDCCMEPLKAWSVWFESPTPIARE